MFSQLLLRRFDTPITIIGALGVKEYSASVKLNMHFRVGSSGRVNHHKKEWLLDYEGHFKFIVEGEVLHLYVNKNLKNPNFEH